ncbi:MAG: hypothetical protein H0W87_06365 [Actinobacteria bacterium]|nr:hypothetical protein [Actinomycetota bacterium]
MRVVVLAGCSALLLFAASAAAEKAHFGYPNSIILIGHSGGTGYGSDPNRPGADAIENSWATGTNPVVDSVYLRILAQNAGIRNHAVNSARDGAKIRDILGQAAGATRLKTKPELVLIQGMDNDITCSGDQAAHLADFKTTFTKVLRTLSRGLPNARIFVTSQLGRPLTYARAIQSVPDARQTQTGTGPCDLFDQAGNIALEHVSFLTQIIESYEHAEADVCAGYVHCRYDGGAMASGVDQLEYLGPDFSHLSISGHGWAAALAWSAIFDFADASAPVSQAARAGRTVTLSASADVGVSGIEYKLTAPKKKPAKWFTRYTKPLTLKHGWTLTWRAVDVNGNSEATHSLRG